eukprot:2504327-Ditylum_brightwellii.AAC.1
MIPLPTATADATATRTIPVGDIAKLHQAVGSLFGSTSPIAKTSNQRNETNLTTPDQKPTALNQKSTTKSSSTVVLPIGDIAKLFCSTATMNDQERSKTPIKIRPISKVLLAAINSPLPPCASTNNANSGTSSSSDSSSTS